MTGSNGVVTAAQRTAFENVSIEFLSRAGAGNRLNDGRWQECKAAAPSVAGDSQAVLDCRTDLILTGDRQLAFANMRHAAVSADLRGDLQSSPSSDDKWRTAAAVLAAGAGALLFALLVLLACHCCRRRGTSLQQSASHASTDLPLTPPEPAEGAEVELVCETWSSSRIAKIIKPPKPVSEQPHVYTRYRVVSLEK